MSKKITCMDCEHFSMWDGDPCCCWKFKFVLPDMLHRCKDFKTDNNRFHHDTNIDFWKQGMRDFFDRVSIKDPLYSQYIKSYPERKSFVNKNENS